MLPVYEDILIISRFWQFTYLLFYLIALRTLLKTNILTNKLVKIVIVWSIYISCINLLNTYYSPFSFLETLVDTLWFPCIYIIFSEFFSKASEINFMKFINKYFLFYFSIILLLIFYLITSFSENKDVYQIENQDLINSIYWILFLVPFCFYFKKTTKYLLFLVILTAIIIASKRSPLLAFSFVLIFSLYRDFLNHNIKNLILGIGATFIIYSIFSLAVENLELNSSQRLTDTATNIDEEPRYIFIAESWNTFKSKDLIKIVFGSGNRSSAIDRGIGMSKTTHNDFFETLYSYGIIGFLMYLYIIIQIIKNVKLIPKNNIKGYNAYVSALIIFLMTSMFTHLIIYPTYIAFLAIIWGQTNLKFNNTKIN